EWRRGGRWAAGDMGRLRPERAARGGRLHPGDVAARRRGGDAAGGRGPLAPAGKRRQERVMLARVIGDQHRSLDAAYRIGMLLKGRVPKIFRKVLLTHSKTDSWRFGIAREGERETDLHGRAIRPFALALEPHRIRHADTSRAKARGIRCRVLAFEDEE